MLMMLAKTDLAGLLIWIGALIAAIVVLTLIIKYVRDKYQQADSERVTASGILDGLRAMRDRGEMSEAEFETIRRQMAEKVRHDMNSAAAAANTGPAVGPYGLDPAVAAKLGMTVPRPTRETIVPPRLPEVDLSGPVKSPYVPQQPAASSGLTRIGPRPRPAQPAPGAAPPAKAAPSEPIPLAPPRPAQPSRSPIISPLQTPRPAAKPPQPPPAPPPAPPPTSG
jgi:hypothetical protein